MVGVEINMVVTDSLRALELYREIFDIEPVEVTNFPRGQNEVIFTLYGMRIHMLDENAEFQLVAPHQESSKSMWFNVLVPDIKSTFSKAIDAGCLAVQPVTEMTDYGISNAIFSDPFGYLWLLHEMHREVSFDERVKLWEDKQPGIEAT